MVQSSMFTSLSSQLGQDWDNSKKPMAVSSFKIETKKTEDSQKKTMDSKNGAWGTTFKNKNHFASLHHC